MVEFKFDWCELFDLFVDFSHLKILEGGKTSGHPMNERTR